MISLTTAAVLAAGVKVEVMKGPGPGERKTAADAVGEAQIRADAGHQAGGKAAFAQDVVHQLQGEVIRVRPGQAQMAHPDFALGQVGAVQKIDAGRRGFFRGRGVGRAGRAAAPPGAQEAAGCFDVTVAKSIMPTTTRVEVAGVISRR